MIVKNDYIRENTSPNPSKGGEQATLAFVCNVSVRKQLPLFWRGLGGGVSGLPRRSYLTARNDVKRTPRRAMPHAIDYKAYSLLSHASRHCEARSKPENYSSDNK